MIAIIIIIWSIALMAIIGLVYTNLNDRIKRLNKEQENLNGMIEIIKSIIEEKKL